METQPIKELKSNGRVQGTLEQSNGLSRRDFLKVAAAGSMAMSSGLLATLSSSGSTEAQQNTSTTAKGTSAISLPSGGGAIRGIGETFKPDLFTGSGNFSVPIAVTPGRAGFGPQLTLQYSTGNGNGPFGLGWQLSVPRVTCKTEKGIPQYGEDDTFVLSGAEDLVPVPNNTGMPVAPDPSVYRVTRFRPRTEGVFARIEQWVGESDTHWRVTTKDNVTNLYGRTKNSRIADPEKPNHTFEWLLEETFDAKGNHILYEYVVDELKKTSSNGNGQHRPSTQTYLRRILYGNVPEGLTTDKRVGPKRVTAGPNDVEGKTPRQYLFEVLFDYGDIPPTPAIPYSWPAEPELQPRDGWVPRQDPFSTCRAGFEIRTRYRCHRVLMLHHFAEGELTGAPLVKSTDFAFDVETHTKLSLLTAVTVTGYRKTGQPGAAQYRTATLPSVRFSYSAFAPAQQRFQALIPEGGTTLPSLNNRSTALLDLFGDGLPDIVSGRAAYWQNLGEGSFVRRELKNFPAGVALGEPGVTIGDLAGDGLPDLLVLRGAASGFYEATGNGGWRDFRPFRSSPPFAFDDPNVRLVDLTGDGRPDLLRTDDRAFVFSRCLGEEGYGPPEYVSRRHDLDEFPDVYFNDPRVHIADMNGDGLQDIVMVHAGRIDYWPNLGHGRFGQRATMKQSPRFGPSFDPQRLFLVDLDGSGCADLVYVEQDHVEFWFNRSGNAWSEQQTIWGTPPVDNLTALQFADLLGRGTATLTWSRDIGANRSGSYRLLDFCGGMKPLLLTEMSNGMGTTTRVRYGVSTTHAIRDRKAGRPWVTTLPFPVQVVDTVEVIDHIGRTKLVTEYKYHDGYYAGREREFRGFASVEQIDSQDFELFAGPGLRGRGQLLENIARWMHVPPVRTVTWFHTGLYFDEHIVAADGGPFGEKDLTTALRQQFYVGDQQAFRLTSHDVDPGSTPHDAYRALRGSILRTELYADDGSEKAKHPYLVTENRYQVKLIPRGIDDRRPPVYLSMKKETVAYHYERNPNDPRVAHDLVLEFDPFGNPLESVSVAYPRRPAQAALPEQQRILATYSIHQYVTQHEKDAAYFIGVPCETVRYEIHNLSWSWPEDKDKLPSLLGVEAFKDIRGRENAVDYADEPPATLAKRLIEWTRTYFRSDASPELIDPIADTADPAKNLAHRLHLREMQSLGLPYETYKAAFSPKLQTKVYGSRLDESDWVRDGGYHSEVADKESDAAGYWWIPSGRQSFDPNQFFQPQHTQDPFGNQTKIERDSYGLLPVKVTDAVGNQTSAQNDYRVLQPQFVTDLNGNRSAVTFDALGLVVATAVMGKESETLGDSLSGLQADLSAKELDAFFDASDPHTLAGSVLGSATTRVIYDLHRFERTQERHPNEPTNWLPVCAATLARETHTSDPLPAGGLKIQTSFSYSDGFGRDIQKKIQAEPEPVLDGGDRVSPRWVGSGWTIFNNKGKPVRQFEPFFSATHRFEFALKIGVSPILLYDPLDRIVGTFHPNHTWEKVRFDPWRQETWDVNDTVTLDPRTDENMKGFLFRKDGTALLPEDEYVPSWYALRTSATHAAEASRRWPDLKDRQAEQDAAEKAKIHANTPTMAHTDVLGRTFLTIAHNRFKYVNTPPADPPGEKAYRTRLILDITGRQREVIDAKDRIVMRYDYDLLGNRVHQTSMEAGERWMLSDVSGNPIMAWDSREHRFRTTYDTIRRPSDSFLRDRTGIELLVGRTVYGESREHPEANNLRSKVVELRDQAGVVLSDQYDFKGNLLRSRRQLAQKYKGTLDWSGNVPLEPDTYTSSTSYDALNRPIELTAPDNSKIRPGYNKANLLRKVDAKLNGTQQGGQAVWAPFIADIDYNAKGQRARIKYGNGVTTTYAYDPLTFRLTHLLTQRNAANFLSDCPQPAPPGCHGCGVQNLSYAYDPVGNITRIRDDAQQTIFFRNKCVEPSADYRYDAVYRLIEATGREHLGQVAGTPIPHSYNDAFRVRLLHPGDGHAMGNYLERYVYDEVGNIVTMEHRGRDPANPGWTRLYAYNETSQLEPTKQSNRLTSTTIGATIETYSTDRDGYDAHGNMLRLPHLPIMQWDFKDQLQMTQRQRVNEQDHDGIQHEGERTYYVYDAAGQRVRKVTESAGGVKKKERVYLGGFELYREHNGSTTPRLERQTLHVMDDKQRIAIVETKSIDSQHPALSTEHLIRFQLGNHLGSTSLELDDQAAAVSYEEYTPYGSSSYQAVRQDTEVPAKRYRHTGKERDEDSGFYYHGARYYAPWFGRWAGCDPAYQIAQSLYSAFDSNPVRFTDPDGSTGWDTVWDYAANIGGTYVDMMRDEFNVLTAVPQFVANNIGKGVLAIQEGELIEAAGWAFQVNAPINWAAESIETYGSAGASGFETAGLMVGDISGVNTLMEGITRQTKYAQDLSVLESVQRSITGLSQLITTAGALAAPIAAASSEAKMSLAISEIENPSLGLHGLDPAVRANALQLQAATNVEVVGVDTGMRGFAYQYLEADSALTVLGHSTESGVLAGRPLADLPSRLFDVGVDLRQVSNLRLVGCKLGQSIAPDRLLAEFPDLSIEPVPMGPAMIGTLGQTQVFYPVQTTWFDRLLGRTRHIYVPNALREVQRWLADI